MDEYLSKITYYIFNVIYVCTNTKCVCILLNQVENYINLRNLNLHANKEKNTLKTTPSKILTIFIVFTVKRYSFTCRIFYGI